jgi:tripartite-type tricarboxylate transporter receptor subunit TctC
MKIKTLALLVMGAFCIIRADAATTPSFSSKPIRLVVAYPPGGSTDILARIVGQKMSEMTGQPVIVDNRGGASGIIGGDAVAKAEGDGHTLLVTGNGPHAINPWIIKKIPYDSATAFKPVALLAKLPLVLVTNPATGINNAGDLVRYAKADKGMKAYASIGNGTPSHLAMEVLKKRAQFDMNHIPYKGSGPALIAIVGGQEAPVLFDSVLSSYPHIKSGKVKAIAVSSAQRLSLLPDVPTLSESGVPGFDISSWTGVFAPASTPPEVVNSLSELMVKVLDLPEVREKILAQGGIVENMNARQFSDFSRAEIGRWKKIVEDAKIQPE